MVLSRWETLQRCSERSRQARSIFYVERHTQLLYNSSQQQSSAESTKHTYLQATSRLQLQFSLNQLWASKQQ